MLLQIPSQRPFQIGLSNRISKPTLPLTGEGYANRSVRLGPYLSKKRVDRSLLRTRRSDVSDSFLSTVETQSTRIVCSTVTGETLLRLRLLDRRDSTRIVSEAHV